MKFLLLLSKDGRAGERGGWENVTGSRNISPCGATYFARDGKVSKAPPGAATHDSIVLSAPPPDPQFAGDARQAGLVQI